MPELGDLRERDGSFELLHGIGSDGEVWVPWATEYVRSSMLPGTKKRGPEPEMSVADALLAEGWISPYEPLPVAQGLKPRAVFEFDPATFEGELRVYLGQGQTLVFDSPRHLTDLPSTLADLGYVDD